VHDQDEPDPSPTVHDRQDQLLATAITAAALVVVVLASVLVVLSGT
jgi:hypothetical protein